MGIINRKRRRPIGGRKTKVDFRTIIVIIGVAALLGYGTAKFIIYPLFDDTQPRFEISKIFTNFLENRETEEEQQNTDTENDGKSGIVEDQLNVTPESTTGGSVTTEASTTAGNIQVAPVQGGYCIQFGSFSTKLGAENLVTQLNNSGITAQIVEKDGAFKVISQLFEQKDQAVESISALQGTQFADAFVVQR